MRLSIVVLALVFGLVAEAQNVVEPRIEPGEVVVRAINDSQCPLAYRFIKDDSILSTVPVKPGYFYSLHIMPGNHAIQVIVFADSRLCNIKPTLGTN